MVNLPTATQQQLVTQCPINVLLAFIPFHLPVHCLSATRGQLVQHCPNVESSFLFIFRLLAQLLTGVLATFFSQSQKDFVEHILTEEFVT